MNPSDVMSSKPNDFSGILLPILITAQHYDAHRLLIHTLLPQRLVYILASSPHHSLPHPAWKESER